MNLSPENALSYQHKEWLSHPVTKQMLQILEKQKTYIMENMASTSADVSTSDVWFRLQAGNIKTINIINLWITNTEQFIQALTLNKQ